MTFFIIYFRILYVFFDCFEAEYSLNLFNSSCRTQETRHNELFTSAILLSIGL